MKVYQKWEKVAVKIKTEEEIESEDKRFKDAKSKKSNEKRDAAVSKLKEQKN